MLAAVLQEESASQFELHEKAASRRVQIIYLQHFWRTGQGFCAYEALCLKKKKKAGACNTPTVQTGLSYDLCRVHNFMAIRIFK